MAAKSRKENTALHHQDLFSLIPQNIQNVAIFTLNPRGDITSWYPGARHLLGYTKKEIIGKPLGFLFPNSKDSTVHLHHDLQKAIRLGQYQHQTQVLTKKRKRLWVNCIITALYNREGILQGFSKIVEDLTDQKELENRREDFISMAGHELKNPLTSIKSYVQLLQLKTRKKHQQEYMKFLEKVSQQIDKLGNLMGDLLDTSRLASGTLHFRDDDTIDVDVFLTNLIENFQPSYPEYEIAFKKPSHAKIKGDATRLEQIFVNLLTNAVKYSPLTKKINILTKKTKSSVIVGIQDFGIGIPENETDKIFERFIRLDGGKQVSSGLGLGLFIAAELVRHYKGEIWVDSTEGKGSTFWVDLPRLRDK